MTFEGILNELSPEIRNRLRLPPQDTAATRIVDLLNRKSSEPFLIEDLAALNPVAGDDDWPSAFGHRWLLDRLCPFALIGLTLNYEAAIETLASTHLVLASQQVLNLPGIGEYPSLELGWTIRFPRGGGEKRILVTAGGKLHVDGFVFDAPIKFPAFKISASAERGKVDFGRLKQLPLMNGLIQTQAARPTARLTDVFVEIFCTPGPDTLVCSVNTVAASNSRDDEETWSRPTA